MSNFVIKFFLVSEEFVLTLRDNEMTKIKAHNEILVNEFTTSE